WPKRCGARRRGPWPTAPSSSGTSCDAVADPRARTVIIAPRPRSTTAADRPVRPRTNEEPVPADGLFQTCGRSSRNDSCATTAQLTTAEQLQPLLQERLELRDRPALQEHVPVGAR